MKNYIDQIHRDRKLIQTLYMDGVLWEDLLFHFVGRYTRSEIMGFVAGQTRQHPAGRERSVYELLHLYSHADDLTVEIDPADHQTTANAPTKLFGESVEQQAQVG